MENIFLHLQHLQVLVDRSFSKAILVEFEAIISNCFNVLLDVSELLQSLSMLTKTVVS